MKLKFFAVLAVNAATLGGVLCFADTSYAQTYTNKFGTIRTVQVGSHIEHVFSSYAQSGSELRMVDGQLYNTQQSVLFKTIEAEVKAVYANGVLFNWTQKKPVYGKAPSSDSLVSEGNFLGGVPVQHERPIISYETISSKDILVLNFQSSAATGENLHIRAMQVGTTNFVGKTIELWDCGKPYVPTPEEIATAKAAQEKAKADAKAKVATAKALAVERALKSNQDAAAKGDSFGLMHMGERYRDGDGVEKDTVKAKEYLQKAVDADASNFIAKEELSKLQQ